MKVVINRCFGGFGLSPKATSRLGELGMARSAGGNDHENWFRCDPRVVQVVEELGKESYGPHAKLRIVEIPFDGPKGWQIEDYDGMESISELHRSWR